MQLGVLAGGCGSSRRLLEEINSQRGRTDGGRVRMRLVQACGLMRVWVEIIYVERVTGGSSLPHPRLAYARPREEHQPSGPPTVTALSAPSSAIYAHFTRATVCETSAACLFHILLPSFSPTLPHQPPSPF